MLFVNVLQNTRFVSGKADVDNLLQYVSGMDCVRLVLNHKELVNTNILLFNSLSSVSS